jgi:hypothetical protein
LNQRIEERRGRIRKIFRQISGAEILTITDFANCSTRLKHCSKAALADSSERKPRVTWFQPPRVKLRFGLFPSMEDRTHADRRRLTGFLWLIGEK